MNRAAVHLREGAINRVVSFAIRRGTKVSTANTTMGPGLTA